MATSYSNTYKNEKRNQSKVLKRQALFISEYVQTKYEGIYTEAASMYNKINKEHPRKPDLRKTLEFRLWKSNVARGNGEPPIHTVAHNCKRKMFTVQTYFVKHVGYKHNKRLTNHNNI